MNLLIVDDENIIVEDLKASINWGKIGVETVFEANNIRQAKEAFMNDKIDIMLCDIEMPQGSGLELLSWVREHYPNTESIFLTCHADFSYAREAIRLGSIDYLLKPVPYAELELIIKKAASKIDNNSKLIETSRYGEFWFKHQPIVIERFWIDIINRSIPLDPKSIKEAAETRNIPYTGEMKFIPVLFGVRRWHNELTLQELKIMEYEIKKIVEEIMSKNGSKGQIFEIDKGKLILILPLWNISSFAIENLMEKCKECIFVCNQNLKCDISGHIGQECYVHELPVIVDELLEQEKNNVAYDNQVFLLQEQKDMENSIVMPDMNIWAIMLAEGSVEPLIFDIVCYLENLVRLNMFNADRLRLIQHDFIQMVYSTLKQRGIRAHELLSDNVSVKLYDNSKRSVKDLIVWIKHVVTKVVGYAAEVDKTETVVNKVKKYIGSNLELELSREDVASHFYLNPDYLDRIFKKETSMSVTKFMLQERLNRAKEMLAKTDMPISMIAVTIGYKNMSHFSMAFKKFTKLNPNDYRKKMSSRHATTAKE